MRRTSTPHDGKRVSGLVALAAFVILLGAALPLLRPAVARAATSDGRPPGGNITNPVVRQIDIAAPAVVRIATLFTAHVTLDVCGQTIRFPQSGAYTAGALGSGAFISADGDILTADHVVEVAKSDLDQGLIDTASQDIADYLNHDAGCSPSSPLTAADVSNGLATSGLSYRTDYSAPRFLTWMDTDYSGSLATSATSQAQLLAGLLTVRHETATLVESSAFAENDLAVLHVDLHDTPSLQMGDSSAIAVDDALSIVGFPGNGDVTNDPTNLLTPSVNTVLISALKLNANGEPLIQVGGNVEHGDSGGPALDAQGQIVGIVSFGGPDSRGSTAFLRSSSSVRALLLAAKLDTRPGPFERAWQAAFVSYSATYVGHWYVAARQLDALAIRYPEFHGVQAFRAYADQAAVDGSVQIGTTQVSVRALVAVVANGLSVVLGALIGVLLVQIVLLVRWLRRRSRAPGVSASVPTASVPTSVPATAWSGASNPPYGEPYGEPYGYAPGHVADYATVPVPVVPVVQHAAEYRPSGMERASQSTQHPTQQLAQRAGAYSGGNDEPLPVVPLPPGICLSGHFLAAGVVYCQMCGAPRATTGQESRDVDTGLR